MNTLQTVKTALWGTMCLMLGLAHAENKPLGFDPDRLTRDNFYQTLAPVAKREGKLVLYNFAGDFEAVWKKGLIPDFEARYGVKVTYRNVRRDQANQQLMAVHKAGMPSPADVYFAGGSDNYPALKAAGAVSAIDLGRLLPNLAAVPSPYKDTVFGTKTGGTWPLVHRSQLVLAYDSAVLPTSQVPDSFQSLLDWAQRHPRQLAITSPGKGGSGSAFIYSAALSLVSDAACQRTLLDQTMSEQQVMRWAASAPCLDGLWQYLHRLLRVSELTNGNADTLNLLNNKQVVIGTTWEDLMLTFVRSQQLPKSMRPALLQKGLVGSGDGLILIANAQNPAAALLFIDMAFDRRFQSWKLTEHASRSARQDVDQDGLQLAESARYLVSSKQIKSLSLTANWTVSRGLAKVFEDKVLSQP